MRFLITGASGFAGSHLADHLLAAGPRRVEVWGCDLSGERRNYMAAGVRLLAADLRDPAAARQVIAQSQPDRIFHLAGQAFVGDSWVDPWATLETNLRAQVNLFEAVLAEGLRPRVLVVSSAEVYGRVTAEHQPISEAAPLRPDSPYSASKAAQDFVALQYFLGHGLPVVRVRPFNHIGPRQNRRFVAPAFASQIAAIEAGRQPPLLRVGNLAARRDFTDVRDMVRAYAVALEEGDPGEVYNIGTGRSRGIDELLDHLLNLARVPIRVEPDPARFRPVDLPDLVCDASKLRACTGWAPAVPFETTLRDLLDYERAQL